MARQWVRHVSGGPNDTAAGNTPDPPEAEVHTGEATESSGEATEPQADPHLPDPGTLAEFLPPGRDPHERPARPPVRLFDGPLGPVLPAAAVPPAVPRNGPPMPPVETAGQLDLDDTAGTDDDGPTELPAGSDLPAGSVPPAQHRDEPPDASEGRPPRANHVRSWLLSTRFQALLAGLLVGALISGLGVYSWQQTRAKAAERDKVLLTARVGNAQVDSPGSWPLNVVIDNLGNAPVRIDSARLTGGQRFGSSLRLVSRGVVLAPGQQIPLTLSVTIDCAASNRLDDALAPTGIELSVAADGGPVRPVRVRLADDDSELAGAARTGCQSGASSLDVTASRSGRPGAAAPVRTAKSLTAEVTVQFTPMSTNPLDSGGGPSGRPVNIRGSVPGLSVMLTRAPLRLPAAPGYWAGTRAPITVDTTLRWTITSCDPLKQLQADYWALAEISSYRTGAVLAYPLRLDGDMTYLISRFIGDVCGS
jgi:hypothetical protein